MSRWFRSALVLTLVLTLVPGGARSARASNPSPDAQWFPDAGFGLFVHWGIASVKGINISWSMRAGSVLSKTRITSSTERARIVAEKDYNLNGTVPLSAFGYWGQANTFDPQSYDPDTWLAAAKAAGFTYAVLTTRHHEGFAMWPSAFGSFNTKNYMNGRDLVGPFVEACRRNGLKVGLYYSPPDWRFDRDYMDFFWPGVRTLNPEFQPLGPDLNPRSPRSRDAAHQDAYAALVRGQVEELLTRYGTIDLLWFDGKPAGLTGDQCITQARIRQLQPGIVINPRLHDTGDFVTYERTFPTSRPSGWAEFCDAWTGTWSYTPNATFHATGHELGVLAKAKAWRMNYLLSNGPMSNGDMTAMAYTKMAEMQAWMAQHSESVSASVRPLAGTESASVPATARGTVRYLYEIPKYSGSPIPGNEIAPGTEVLTLSGVTKPGRVTLLRTGASLPFTYSGSTASITVAASVRTNLVDVVKVDLATTPTPTPTPRPTPTPSPDVEITPGASAVTASTNDGNLPGNAVDDNLATRWSANGDGQWLQLDLGTARTVASVKVALYNGNARQSRFDVQVSSGSGVWSTVWSGASSGTTTALETFDFADVSARWVRYLGHGNTVNSWNSVTEVQVWGH
jgi:alpha-L-fucosidase